MKFTRSLAVIASLFAVAPLAVHVSHADTPWQCTAGVNMYDYPASVSEACGYPVFPLDHVATRADGGQDYVYYVDGGQTVLPVPPANFDPETATSADLAYYGYPERPTDASALAAWDTQVDRTTVEPPPPFLIELPIDASGSAASCAQQLDYCWGGYVDTGATFDDAYMDYYEPGQEYACQNDAVVVWTGIGAAYGSDYPLAQAGTAPYFDDTHYEWYQVYPDMKYLQPLKYTVSAGDRMQVRVTYDGADTYHFTIYDWTTGVSTPAQYSGAVEHPASNESAEFIVERPTAHAGYITPLRDFYTGLTVNAAQANGVGMQSPNYTLYRLNIVNDQQPPSTLETTWPNNGTQSFTAYWQKCG